jgi:hypothetical protein
MLIIDFLIAFKKEALSPFSFLSKYFHNIFLADVLGLHPFFDKIGKSGIFKIFGVD